jgi:hypothetical protein
MFKTARPPEAIELAGIDAVVGRNGRVSGGRAVSNDVGKKRALVTTPPLAHPSFEGAIAEPSR